MSANEDSDQPGNDDIMPQANEVTVTENTSHSSINVAGRDLNTKSKGYEVVLTDSIFNGPLHLVASGSHEKLPMSGAEFLHRQRMDELSKIRKAIGLYLKNKYADLEIPILPWMDDISMPIDKYYVELEMFPTDTIGRVATEEPSKLETILEPVNGKSPKRILIEGRTGFGKSTIALKMTRDWESKSDSYLSQFDLLFAIPLRDLTGSLKDALVEEARVDDYNDDLILEAIKTTQEKILIILDGYDEMPWVRKKDIENVIKQRLFPFATVIVTSRPSDLEDIRGRFQKRLAIKEFNPQQQADFFGKYISDEVIAENIRINFPEEFLKCPLMLMLGYFVYGENRHRPPSTKTEWYKSIFDMVARREILRKKICIETEELRIRRVHEMMIRFGKLALYSWLQGMLYFTRDQLLYACEDLMGLTLGFLSENHVVDGIRVTRFFEPIHQSFLEFFIAMYAVDCLQDKEEYDVTNILGGVIAVQSSAESILLFMAELSGIKVDELKEMAKIDDEC